MSTRCSRCEGRGYHHWFGGSFSVCEKCEGSGKPMGDAPPIVREMMRVIDDLRGRVNERATNRGRDYHNNANHKPPGLRCVACRGNGFNPDDSPNHWGITKCRKCNGTGMMGKIDPTIERLWYEINRLNNRIEEIRFEKSMKDFGRGRSFASSKPDVTINDSDVWRHILGIGEKDGVEAIKRAYRQKAKETHPDHGGNDLDFRMIKMAYDKLLGGLSQ